MPQAAPLWGTAANKVQYVVLIVNNIAYKVLVLLAYLQHCVHVADVTASVQMR